MGNDLKSHGLTVSISTVATLIPVLAISWLFVKPALVQSIGEAVADDFDDKISEKTAPIQSAFRVLLLSDINRLKRNIARLEFKKDDHDETYTSADAVRLADYKIELDAYDEAYDDLKAK